MRNAITAENNTAPARRIKVNLTHRLGAKSAPWHVARTFCNSHRHEYWSLQARHRELRLFEHQTEVVVRELRKGQQAVPVPGVLVNIVRNCVCLNGCRRRNVKVITIFDAGNRTKKSNRMARAVSEQTSSHRFTGDCPREQPELWRKTPQAQPRARAVSQRSGMWFWIGILCWRGCGMAWEAVRLGSPGPIPGATPKITT